MTKNATKMKKSVSILMVILTLMSVFAVFAVPASAAMTSSGTQARTITVTTKANWLVPGSESITLSQNKGTCVEENYNFFTGQTTRKTSKQYGEWDITVRATDGSHTYSKTLTGGSIKLNLKPNKTYKITVSWDSQAAIFKALDKGNYSSYPTWKVKSTWKVSSYY